MSKLLSPSHYIGLAEVPDEIALCINISECPIKCKGCHSPGLQTRIGNELTNDKLKQLIEDNQGISVISIMGGDLNPLEVNNVLRFVKDNYPELKTCWYSGKTKVNPLVDLSNLDYVKLGAYVEDQGGLDNVSTNQRFYHIVNKELVDITKWFWRNKII